MERKFKTLILTLLVVVVFINAARMVVGCEDSSALEVLSQLKQNRRCKMLKHIKEIKAVVLHVPDHKVDELKKSGSAN
jgi:subtilisin